MPRTVTDDDVGLKVLYEPTDGKVGIDIIAIHGIGAHPDDTWCKDVSLNGRSDHPNSKRRKGERKYINWLKDKEMLPSAITDARIMRFGYQSQWFGRDALQQNASSIAPRLLDGIKRQRRDVPNRPLIFIAHSFGGLAVLRALQLSHLEEKQWPGVSISTVGLVFFGTPFRGSQALHPTKMIEAALSQHESYEVQPGVLHGLEPDTEYLKGLVGDFLRIWKSQPKKAKILCLYEQRANPISSIVGTMSKRIEIAVTEAEGCLDSSAEEISSRALSRSHFGMNKFAKPTEDDFQMVCEFLQEMKDGALELLDNHLQIAEPKHNQSLAEQDHQLSKLPYAHGAAFDSYDRQHEPQCIPDTRVDLLNQFENWNQRQERCIFWLNGMAGTGKSTIARTVASNLDAQKSLGASFFFSRGVGDLGHAAYFISTLARQLAERISVLKPHICKAITENPNIFRQGLRSQWKELIIQPLIKSKGQCRPLTLVIDALDECDNEEDIKLILQLFVEAKSTDTVDLGVLLTSRPETPIRLGFEYMPEIIHKDLILHDIPRQTVEHDILVFLKHEFMQISKEHKLKDWPNNEKIKLVLQASDCIFIYAATVCRFVRQPGWHPEERLDLILQGSNAGGYSTAKLDKMYIQVLRAGIAEDYSEQEVLEHRNRFKHIVGSIVALSDVLSIPALAKLLSKPIRTIEVTLSSLHSLLNIPKEPEVPIRLLHPSFPDFLLDSKRCRDTHFVINREAATYRYSEKRSVRLESTWSFNT